MTYELDRGELEFLGPVKVRHFTMEITNYDDDAAGDGEPFQAADAGFNRIMHCRTFAQGDGVAAAYDENTGAIRLYQQANDAGGTANDPLVEAPSNSNEAATVQVTVMGK